MPNYYYVSGVYQAAWNTTVPVTVLNDGSPGNTSTYVLGNTYTHASQSGYSSLTAFYDNGAAAQLTGFQFTVVNAGPDAAASLEYILEGSNNTTTWVDSFVSTGVATDYGGIAAGGSLTVTVVNANITDTPYRYWRLSVRLMIGGGFGGGGGDA